MIRKLFRLQNKIFLSMAVIVALFAGAAGVNINKVVQGQSEATIQRDLVQSRRVFEELQKGKYENLLARLGTLQEEPRLKAALDLKKPDPPTVQDLCQDLKQGFDLFQVTEKKGRLMASYMGEQQMPEVKELGKDDPPFDPIFAKAVDPEHPQQATGALFWNNRLYLTATGPIIIKRKLLGAVRAGVEMNEKLAKSLEEQTGSAIAFTVGTKVIGSSLDPGQKSELESRLQSMGAAMAGMGQGTFNMDLANTPNLGQATPLKDPEGKVIGYQIQFRSKSAILSLLHQVRQSVLLTAIIGVVFAILLSFFIARGVTRPLDKLIEATVAVEQDNFDYRLNIKTRDELGTLADSFNEMIKELKEKERVKSVFGKFLSKAVAERALAHEGELMLGGEQREVTMLFSDIRGFTAMSENMPPHDIIAMLNDYFTRMVDVLLAHDGTLDKYVGDEIMAVFGAPVADEQAPAKAIKTALGMMEALHKFNEERASKNLPTFSIGIGINSGIVVAGNLGSIKQLSYTVIGEEVNLASRLCANAKKGQILVSEATYRRVKWDFEFNRLEPITVKNVTYPVQIYEVLGIRPGGSQPPTA